MLEFFTEWAGTVLPEESGGYVPNNQFAVRSHRSYLNYTTRNMFGMLFKS